MKKSKIAVIIATAAALASLPALGGCSGDHYSKISFPKQDTSYAVTSQGGSAVAYGNYVYFINGTRGYEDTDGKNNVWDEVVKGAIYRAELKGEKVKNDGDAYATFKTDLDTEAGLEFKYTAGKDYFDNDINIVDVAKIAPKTAGTSGYSDGGIFIYDNYLYFATPHNLKSATGTVQVTRTDFFMMPLDGGKPTLVYTTSEGVDTSSSAYAFYKFKNAVYLVVDEVKDEVGTIVSVRIDPAKAKADDPKRFDAKVTSVYFPVRDTYYTGIDNNTLEDYIYFVRDVKDTEPKPVSGTVIEVMRPDGSEGFIVSKSGQTESIEAVRDGMLFYRTTVSGTTRMAYNNLHEDLMAHAPTYKAAQDKLDEKDKNVQASDVFPLEISSDITSTYAYRPDMQSNEVFYIGATSSGINRYGVDGNIEKLCDASGTPLFIENNYLYCSSDSNYSRIALYSNMDGFGTAVTVAENTTSATFGCDYAAGYFTYFGEVDKWATGYTFFYKVDGKQGLDPQFVGQRASSDIPTDEQIEAEKNGESGETDE